MAFTASLPRPNQCCQSNTMLGAMELLDADLDKKTGTMKNLCDDVLYRIFSCTVEGFHEVTWVEMRTVSTSLTLMRLSHVDARWRSLVVKAPHLWAQHLDIGPNTSADWIGVALKRASNLTIRLHLMDPAMTPGDAKWLHAVSVFPRCTFLRFQQRDATSSSTMGLVITTPAPVLEECIIDCDATGRVLVLWKPLFANAAPQLKTIRLTAAVSRELRRSGSPGAPLSIAGLICLQRMSHLTVLDLTCLENSQPSSPFRCSDKPLKFPRLKVLKIASSPPFVAHFLDATDMPNMTLISVTCTVTMYAPLQHTQAILGPLLRHYHPQAFTHIGFHIGEGGFRFQLISGEGRALMVQLRCDELPRPITRHPVSIPPPMQSQVDEQDGAYLDLLHEAFWAGLAEHIERGIQLAVATTGSVSRGMFPWHAKALFTHFEVRSIRFADVETAGDMRWREMLRSCEEKGQLKHVCCIHVPNRIVWRSCWHGLEGIRHLLVPNLSECRRSL
ncbi:hypothetical protein FA13DRAFT_1717864 [Coprinellus micaceus]|uniref:F-box domain-containing protein n=1 Tax=Coprinellus micaceus TaxID=71717 RepID=A0A4Y7SF63_COPMI|nr:hypothetical protein FA13DRAFT_1717864 [Coprinellus micaceus]